MRWQEQKSQATWRGFNMNSKQRLAAVNKGELVDRIPFLPTILEHSAKLLNKTPSEVALDGKLLVEAQIKAYKLYGHDAITVGIDVYNIEAEALGCIVRYYDDYSIPGIITHLFEDESISECIDFSTGKGRLKTILNAASSIDKAIGDEINVGIGICGPFSILIELKGYENVIFSCISDKVNMHSMLETILKFQKSYCNEIIKRGIGMTIFESWATPPLISPDIYKEFVKPYEKELIQYIKGKGVAAVPLVIGGDTTLIVDDIIETGTTLLVADYAVDIAYYVEKASGKNLLLRGNIDPKLVQRGPREEILKQTELILKRVNNYRKFVMGTGVIPYDTPSDNILLIKNYLEENYSK
jgi:uroporphyrinogen decarboxylase